MAFTPKSEDQQAEAITRLVDDSLSESERPAVAEWARGREDVSRQVEAQRRVAQQLRTGGPAVPEQLVSAVDAKVQAANAPHRRFPVGGGRGSASKWRPAIAVGALAAVAAVAIGLVLALGAGAGPSIPGAARLAFAPSTGPAPAASSATLLDVSYGGVTYPNYSEFRVKPTGTRTDQIGGRQALTVFYRLPGGAPLSYTVFSGPPVRLPAEARSVTYDGVPLRVFSTSSGLAVVTLVRHGRTCVLAAPTDRDAVLTLAAAPVRAQAA